jgi:hypothetical protein
MTMTNKCLNKFFFCNLLSKLTMPSKYLCAFLRPDDRPPPLLGNSSRLDIKSSNKEVDASLFLYLLFHSPNPWKLEQEHLEELRKIFDSASQKISETC